MTESAIDRASGEAQSAYESGDWPSDKLWESQAQRIRIKSPFIILLLSLSYKCIVIHYRS